MAVITRRVIQRNSFFNVYTDKEKDILGKYSSNLFTLSTLYNANKRIARNGSSTDELEEFLDRYWQAVVRNVIPWQELVRREISKVELRENYIVTQSVIIQVLGRLGNYFYLHRECDLDKYLGNLRQISWLRNDPLWRSRTIKGNGRMINNEEAIILTSNVLKQELGIPLDEQERKKERAFAHKVD